MFTTDCTIEDNSFFTNPIQEIPLRLSLLSVYRCENATIGFEFVKENLTPKSNTFCNKAYVLICDKIQVLSPIKLDKVEFRATSDPCYKDWEIIKTDEPSIESQKDSNGNTIGVLVRFFKDETCCFPQQMAFHLYGYDSQGCRFSLSNGSLIFK